MNLKRDLERKEEEYADLKEKLSDAMKQLQQVQSEVSTMRSVEKSLRNKIDELERIKRQYGEELDIKKLTIHQLKQELLNNEKLEEVSKQYEKMREDLCAKEKIIEVLRMTLEEQEETQLEQDRVLEAHLEENERLVSELETWKQKCRELQNLINSGQQQKNTNSEEANMNEKSTELIKLQKELEESEAKYQTDRKKWLEEKEGLLNQIKEAENLRNREMKKFAEDRQRHGKQQAEIERLVAQLEEKDRNLQKWREERDQLVEALEVQLKTLASNAIQKEKEIAELKQSAAKDSSKDNEAVIEELRKELAVKDDFIKELKQCINRGSPQSLPEVPLLEERQGRMDRSVHEEPRKKQRKSECGDEESIPVRHEAKDNYSSSGCSSSVTSLNESGEHSETVLDSSEVSTENGKASRFPKPEVEIQLTPLQPDKMEIKQHGSMLPARVKMPKTRKKRKSDDMDEDFVKSENMKNAKSVMAFNSPSTSDEQMKSRKEYFLRKQVRTSSKRLTSKKDATLQRIGDFLQNSPSIIHSKAKKLMAAVSSPKPLEPESLGEEIKPKRSKRKLYSTDISGPLDISASSILVEQIKKESDHLIIKRRLRSKTAK